MKKRSIISVLLVIAMIFTLMAFTSCNKEEAAESFTVNMKITSSKGDILCDDPLLLSGIPSDLTVLYATKKMCVEILLEVDFIYDADLDAVIQIGTDIFDEEKLAEIVEEEGEEAAAAANDNSYYDWQSYVNGVEAGIHTKLKAGDKIEWKWQKFIPEDMK